MSSTARPTCAHRVCFSARVRIVIAGIATRERPERTSHGEAIRKRENTRFDAASSSRRRSVGTMSRWSEIVSRRRSVDGYLATAMALLAWCANAEAAPAHVMVSDNAAAVSETFSLPRDADRERGRRTVDAIVKNEFRRRTHDDELRNKFLPLARSVHRVDTREKSATKKQMENERTM